jgi:hypothetical protein
MATSHRSYDTPAEIVALTGTSQLIAAGNAVLYGFEVSDDTQSSVHAHLHNGTDNTGPIVAGVKPPNNDHDAFWFGPNGVHCPDGIFLDVTSGTPEGSVFVRR